MNNEVRYFQWVVSEQQGQVVIFDHIETDEDIVFICFKGGSRINEALVAQLNAKDLTGKMMAEIDHPNNCWKFKEEWVGREEEKWEIAGSGERVCVQPLVEGRKTIKLLAPKPTPPRSSNFGQISNVPPPPPPLAEDPKDVIDKTDPVYIVLNTSKKFDVDIQMSLTVSVPSKDLFNIIKENYDDGENKTIHYIIEHINTEEIKNSLINSFKDYYLQDNNK